MIHYAEVKPTVYLESTVVSFLLHDRVMMQLYPLGNKQHNSYGMNIQMILSLLLRSLL